MNLRTSGVFAVCVVAMLPIFGSGCSMSLLPDTLQAARYHETRSIEGDTRTVHQACRTALEQLGYEAERASWASGTLEMHARIRPGDSAQTRLQRRVEVLVKAGSVGTSDVAVGFWEVSEEASGTEIGGTSARLLRSPEAYEIFWQRVGEAMEATPAVPEAPLPAPPAS